MRSEAESHPSIGPEIANPGADLANFLNFFGTHFSNPGLNASNAGCPCEGFAFPMVFLGRWYPKGLTAKRMVFKGLARFF